MRNIFFQFQVINLRKSVGQVQDLLKRRVNMQVSTPELDQALRSPCSNWQTNNKEYKEIMDDDLMYVE